jgi:glycosyltransferase involved in cell wall biosynthesis
MTPGSVFVVRSGPDLARIRRLPPDASLKRGRRYLVTYVGIMGKQDGVDRLLRAADHLVHGTGRQDVQFLLVGGGTELERMRALSADLGLDDHVTFTGLQPPNSDLLWTALSTADVGVSPDPPNAMNDKSTMNKVLEYMTFGKPVVQFNLTEGRASAGAASRYAAGGDPVDLARQIEALLDDEAERARMGEVGRRRIQTMLGWEHQRPALLAAYEAAFAPPVRSPRPWARLARLLRRTRRVHPATQMSEEGR